MVSSSSIFSKNKEASTVQHKASFLGVFSRLQLLEYHSGQAEAVLKGLSLNSDYSNCVTFRKKPYPTDICFEKVSSLKFYPSLERFICSQFPD